MSVRVTNSQRAHKNEVSANDVASLALRLCELAGEYSDEKFKLKFEFAFNILVDAQHQLDKLAQKL